MTRKHSIEMIPLCRATMPCGSRTISFIWLEVGRLPLISQAQMSLSLNICARGRRLSPMAYSMFQVLSASVTWNCLLAKSPDFETCIFFHFEVGRLRQFLITSDGFRLNTCDILWITKQVLY